MTAPPAFLFDLDGTLADTLADLAASANHVRGRAGLPPLPLATVRSFIGDGARTLVARALADVMPRDPAAAARVVADGFAAYVDHHRTQCVVHSRLYPGVREHLMGLRERGHPLGVVTNKPERFAVPLLRHLELADWFGVIVGGDTLPQQKPDKAPVVHALHVLGSSAEGATMVGDGVQDLRAGKAAGLRTIACLFGFTDPAALRAEGADEFWPRFGRP